MRSDKIIKLIRDLKDTAEMLGRVGHSQRAAGIEQAIAMLNDKCEEAAYMRDYMRQYRSRKAKTEEA